MVNFGLCVLKARMRAFIKYNVLNVVLILANPKIYYITLAQKIDVRASNKKITNYVYTNYV